MNDVIIEVSSKTGSAYKKDDYQKIGNQHQNLQNKLKFEFKDNVPEGIAWLEYEIDGVKKYALMEECESGYQIDIKSCLLISDYVSVDIKITEEPNPDGIPVFVSTIVKFAVAETINAEEEEPEEYPDWKDVISSKLAEFESTEKTRNENETSRINAETERNSNEKKRVEQESIRVSNETVRVSNESERVSSETERNTNEETRISNENQRIENENTRIKNETAREDYINDLKEKVDNGEFNGNCNFATFEIDIETGELIMNKTEDLLLDFQLNQKGELEVIIDG